jgi:hypothetical protein
MVKCKICGTEKEISIVEHLRHTHKLSVPGYREIYPDADVKSEEAKKLVSEQHKKVWQDENYRKRMCESRQVSHRKESFREAQSKRIKAVYERGFISWNAGLTKESDERVASVGRKNSEHLTGRTKEDYEYLKKRSEDLVGIIPIGFDQKKWSEEKIQAWKEKISKAVSEGIAEGKYSIPKNGYSKGWYEKQNGEKEYYESSWELELMNHLDSLNIEWTKKHKIIISYKDETGDERRYIPDFLITFNNKKLLLELKGFSRSKPEIESKKKSAEIWAIENLASYRLCWSVDEAKFAIKEIYEIFKNSKN